ncbi:homoserine kinase [Nanoarchaeota archaeon]
MKQVAIYAPATIANVGPGYDIFGLALNSPGDIVVARLTDAYKGVRLTQIIGNDKLPKGPTNVVQAVGQKILEYSGQNVGIELILYKNMKIGTGMGSSASSSVAAAVAVNEILGSPFKRSDQRMLDAVVHGEAIATKGSGHPDNVLPSLLGGFQFIYDGKNYAHTRFEGGKNLYFVVVSPDIVVETGPAREALKKAPYHLDGVVQTSQEVITHYLSTGKIDIDSRDLGKLVKKNGSEQIVHDYLLGGIEVVSGIRDEDLKRLERGVMMDGIVTPVRADFIDHYYDVRDAIFAAGAKCFSISGSGPSVFSVTDNEEEAHILGDAGRQKFEDNKIKAQVHVSQINNQGAREV